MYSCNPQDFYSLKLANFNWIHIYTIIRGIFRWANIIIWFHIKWAQAFSSMIADFRQKKSRGLAFALNQKRRIIMSFWRRSAIKELNYCAQNFIKMLYLKSEISPKYRYRLWLFNKVAKSLWINHLVSVIIFFIFKCGVFSKKSSNQIFDFLGRLFWI